MTVSPSAGVGSEPGDIRTISYQRETQLMAHPIIEEFCRIHSPERMQTIFFRRMQRVLRDEVQPMLDERDRLLAEVEAAHKERDYYIKLRDEETRDLSRLTAFASERCDLSDVGGNAIDWAIKTIEAKPARKPKSEAVQQ
jgi:hypothetical protein